MKKILFTIILTILFSTNVFAEWKVNFEDNYLNDGIDQAVVEALKEGAEPVAIVVKGLDIEGLNPQNLVIALYCAGVKGADIRDASLVNGISEEILTIGYKKSIVECGDAVADSQAYTPVATGFSGGRSPGSGGRTFASASTF